MVRLSAFRLAILAAAAGALLTAAGCLREPPPVASVEGAPALLRLPYPGCAFLRLLWRPSRRLDRLHGRPVAFVHLLDRPSPPWTVLRTFDHALPREWKPGQSQSEEIGICQSALAPPLPAGAYVLSLGLYDESWGYRWPLAITGGPIGRREYRIASVAVPADSGPQPRFEFSGKWLAAEPGSGSQVLARRWLAGEGTLGARDIPFPGRIHLWTRASGEAHPGVRVRSSCGGEELLLSPGAAAVSFPTPASGESGCDLWFQPLWSAPAAPAPTRLFALEMVAWSPTTR